MAKNFSSMLFLFTFLVMVNENFSFPGHIPIISFVPNSLNYFTHRINLIQPVHGVRKILFPEINGVKRIPLRPYEGQYMAKQNLPSLVPNMTNNITEFSLNITKENENFNQSNRSFNNDSNIQNKEIDKKWNLFFDQYFKNQTIKSKTASIKNTEIHTIPEDIFEAKYTENSEETSEFVTTTDTTDTTPYDSETTTEDDLLRNGLPPEVISSLLG
ncbi:uncharacterized protein LOC116765463 [Danaus plexippus]|uniref:uncharacterized protein LOC116765463 n=1 Tax=Danaus plexippus TaxID=13037 RepID=UPI002AB0FEC4|nr:uncharacterized protein LOC116765463 [Danaus plexippus]